MTLLPQRLPVRLVDTLTLLMVVACMWVQPVLVRADPTAVLDAAPADPAVVIVVPKLSQLSDKLAMLNTALGMGVPQMANALTEFKNTTGMIEGINDDGAMLLIMPETPDFTGQSEPSFVMLMPVNDYGKFVGQLGGNAEDASTAITMPGQGAGFARKLEGGYAVLAANQELVTAYTPAKASAALGTALGMMGQKYAGESDLYVLVNLKKMSDQLQQQMSDGLAKAKEEMQANMEMNPPAQQEQVKLGMAMLDLYALAGQVIVRDGDMMLMGIDINDLGVGLTSTVQFTAGSPSALFFGKTMPASKLTALLNDSPYLAISSINFDGMNLQPIVDAVAANLPEGNDPFLNMMKQAMPLAKLTKGGTQAWLLPNQAGGQMSLMNTVSITQASDGVAYKDQLQKLFTALGAANAQPQQDAGGGMAPMTYTLNYSPNAMKIGETSVDQYQMQMNMPPEMMQQMGPVGPAMMMLGLTGYSGYIAQEGEFIVATTTLDTQMVKNALTGVSKGQGMGSAGTIVQVREKLTPEAMAETYLSIGSMANLANQFMVMFGAQQQIQVPADLPPIGGSVSAQNGNVAGRFYIPMPVMTFIKDTTQQLGPMMGGGGGPRGGANPGAPY